MDTPPNFDLSKAAVVHTTLSFTWTDLRGCKVPDARICEMLNYVRHTERDVLTFMGADVIRRRGAAFQFLCYYTDFLSNWTEQEDRNAAHPRG